MFSGILTRSLRQACSVASRVQATKVAQDSRPFTVLANKNLGQYIFRQGENETDEEHEKRYLDAFNDPEADGWDIRSRFTDLYGQDLIPEPSIIIAALHACRRVNDLGLAIRMLEALYFKCGTKTLRETCWAYIVQEIKPTCDELGVPFPEEIGYDKPELWLDKSRQKPFQSFF